MTDDPHPHLRPAAVTPDLLARWADIAGRIGAAGVGLVREIDSLKIDPTAHMLGRLHKACRMSADHSGLTGDAALMLQALATEVDAAIART